MPERVSRSQRSQTSFVGCLRRNGRRRGQCLFQHSSQIGTVLNILSLLGESLSLLGESIHASLWRRCSCSRVGGRITAWRFFTQARALSFIIGHAGNAIQSPSLSNDWSRYSHVVSSAQASSSITISFWPICIARSACRNHVSHRLGHEQNTVRSR